MLPIVEPKYFLERSSHGDLLPLVVGSTFRHGFTRDLRTKLHMGRECAHELKSGAVFSGRPSTVRSDPQGQGSEPGDGGGPPAHLQGAPRFSIRG